ncbi:hypothetical protein HAX54_031570 [Datura stramonium]|uniref:Uncharacterized protein n=1 Tax=Datura stramonium TaxID=4076 RepID=A0ABS8RL70_DATST|nr:hypothetical protein [Datura stramonium]
MVEVSCMVLALPERRQRWGMEERRTTLLFYQCSSRKYEGYATGSGFLVIPDRILVGDKEYEEDEKVEKGEGKWSGEEKLEEGGDPAAFRGWWNWWVFRLVFVGKWRKRKETEGGRAFVGSGVEDGGKGSLVVAGKNGSWRRTKGRREEEIEWLRRKGCGASRVR